MILQIIKIILYTELKKILKHYLFDFNSLTHTWGNAIISQIILYYIIFVR